LVFLRRHHAYETRNEEIDANTLAIKKKANAAKKAKG